MVERVRPDLGRGAAAGAVGAEGFDTWSLLASLASLTPLHSHQSVDRRMAADRLWPPGLGLGKPSHGMVQTHGAHRLHVLAGRGAGRIRQPVTRPMRKASESSRQ